MDAKPILRSENGKGNQKDVSSGVDNYRRSTVAGNKTVNQLWLTMRMITSQPL